MSSFIKNKKNRFIRQLSKNMEIHISIFMFFIFLVVSVIIIKEINPVKENIPNYLELSKNPYVKYEELLDRTDLKKIMNNKQFLEMRYDENVIKKEDPLEKEDPFIERFSNEYNNEDSEGGENSEEKEDASEGANKEEDNEEGNNNKEGDNEN